MEVEIQKSLLKRSTLYKGVDLKVWLELAKVAEEQGLDCKGVTAAFDKFMTVSRQDNTTVSAADVHSFATKSTKKKANAQANAAAQMDNFFKRGSWEEAFDGGENMHLSNRQRMTPYLNKSAVRQKPVIKRQETPQTASKTFRERSQSGAVQVCLNPNNIETNDIPMENPPPCHLEVLGWPLGMDDRYMVDSVQDKVTHLEQRITALEAEVEAICGEDSVHAVATIAQQPTYFVGRICCDAEEGRLNAQSALLEGSIKTSMGSRVRLDLTSCSEYRLFPGQVVAVKGTNPSGHCVVASEVVAGLPLPMESIPMEQVAEHGTRTQSYVVAVGPFTTNEDLTYEPLTALLDYCKTHKPDALILVGPFVDADHPAMQDGLLDETFEDLFESRVMWPLQEFKEAGNDTQVMLVPSQKDLHHDPVFPQPPFDIAQAALPLPNPATFRCNGVTVGCTSVDWIKASAKEEIAHVGGPADRLAALSSHVISQRSFYPLFPAALETALDSSKARALELPCTPDVLVLPSDLTPFAKLLPVNPPNLTGTAVPGEAGQVVCINPGRLTKGSTGGTFAHFYVAPSKEALEVADGGMAATNAPVLQKVDQRCKVEIKRI